MARNSPISDITVRHVLGSIALTCNIETASQMTSTLIATTMKHDHPSISRYRSVLALCDSVFALAVVLMLALVTTHANADVWPSQAVPGTFDTTFGSNESGKIIELGVTLEGSDYLRAIAVQPDQKIIVAGQCGEVWKFCVARLLSSGVPDPSFIGDNQDRGKFTVNVGTPGQNSYASAVAIQPDGKLLIAGSCTLAPARSDACIVRLLPDGRFDPTFIGPSGTARGAFTLAIGNNRDSINTVLVQPDGKIVMAGLCDTSFTIAVACAARLMPDGALDPTFVGPLGTGTGTFVMSLSGTSDFDVNYLLQPDMTFMIASSCRGDPQEPFGTRACLTKLDSIGRFDTSFNPNGTPGQIKYISGGNLYFTTAGIALQPDGKLVLAASCLPVATEPEKICLIRYSADGIVDRTFVGPNRQGRGSFAFPISGVAGIALARNIALQSDGKIVVSGLCKVTVNSGTSDICVARMHGDGTADTSFDGPNALAPGNGGFMQLIGPSILNGLRLQIQSDGQILHGAYCRLNANGGVYRMCIARINGGPYAAPQCSLDIDGDGTIGTVTDILIATRAALGFTGAIVYGGITFAESATRRNWSSIHRYFTQKCGMPLPPFDPSSEL